MKKIVALSAGTITFLTIAVPAFAQQTNQFIGVGPNDIANAAPPSLAIGAVIGFIVGAAVVFGIIAALLFIIIGAFNWITSGGAKDKVESARNHIVAAIVGLVIIFLSVVILNFVLTILGIGSLANLNVKTLTTPNSTVCPGGHFDPVKGACVIP